MVWIIRYGDAPCHPDLFQTEPDARDHLRMLVAQSVAACDECADPAAALEDLARFLDQVNDRSCWVMAWGTGAVWTMSEISAETARQMLDQRCANTWGNWTP